jgi:hypothetical protein
LIPTKLSHNSVRIGSEPVQLRKLKLRASRLESLLPGFQKETTMLRNSLLIAALIALTPAIAMAAPAAPAKAPAAMTSAVKTVKPVTVKHHAKVKKQQITTKLHHKAKAAIVKS